MPLQPGSTFQGAFVINSSKHGPWTSEDSILDLDFINRLLLLAVRKGAYSQ